MLLIVVPVILMLIGGRTFLDNHHPRRLQNLGRIFGIVCNVVAIFFVLQSTVIFCFPYTMVCCPRPVQHVEMFLTAFKASDNGRHELWYDTRPLVIRIIG